MDSANGVVGSSSPSKGRTALQAIVLPAVAAAAAEQLWAIGHWAAAEKRSSGAATKRGSLQQQQQQQRTKSHITVVHCKLKVVILIEGNAPPPKKKKNSSKYVPNFEQNAVMVFCFMFRMQLLQIIF